MARARRSKLREPSPAMTAPSPSASWSTEDYLEHRAKQYQGWYDAKASSCKSRYLSMQSCSVVAGGLVPVLVNVDFDAREWATTALSLLVVILVSLEGVLHYREQWKNYRSTEQYLGREEQWFRAGIGPYKGLSAGDSGSLLVERIEAAITAENAATLSVMTLGPPEEST